MSAPLANADESGFGENEDFVSVGGVVVILEGELDELVGLQVPLEEQVPIIVDPDDFAVRTDDVGE